MNPTVETIACGIVVGVYLLRLIDRLCGPRFEDLLTWIGFPELLPRR